VPGGEASPAPPLPPAPSPPPAAPAPPLLARGPLPAHGRLAAMMAHNGSFERRAAPLVGAPLPRRIVIVTCMDPRLKSLLAPALGLSEGEAFIVKNAGAVITHPFGGITRSVFVALYELGAEEVFIIGHRDCGMTKLSSAAMVAKMVARGVTRQALVTLQYSGANLQGWLSGFPSVEDSIYNSVDVIRNHPLCPLDVPVHGLVIDPATGKLELLVDGNKELPVLTGGLPAGHAEWLASMPPFAGGSPTRELFELGIARAGARARAHTASEDGEPLLAAAAAAREAREARGGGGGGGSGDGGGGGGAHIEAAGAVAAAAKAQSGQGLAASLAAHFPGGGALPANTRTLGRRADCALPPPPSAF
jgi:carbonic anhydrase